MTARLLSPIALAFAAALAFRPCSGAFEITNTAIYVRVDEGAVTRQAADELARYLGLMLSVRIEVKTVEPGSAIDAKAPAIGIGRLAGDWGLKMEKQSRARDGFRYGVVNGRLAIVGESPQGELHGVYDLLERFGCGWFAPGAVGEVIPRMKTISLPDDLDHSAVSDSVNRRIWYGGKGNPDPATAAWLARNKAEHQVGSWNHAWHGLVDPKALFESNPDLFSLNRGKRTTKQLCTTNPETLRVAAASLLKKMEAEPGQVVFAAGPNDGGNLCECDRCAKLDTPGYVEPSSGMPACADRVFGFANELAAITSKDQPGKDLGVLVYSEYSRPPKRFGKLHANVFPMIAPIRRCRFHGPGNPVCPTAMLLDEEIAAWGGMTNKLGFYVYNYNLADTLVPLSKIGYFKRLSAAIAKTDPAELAWIFESIDSWSQHAPHLYLSARLAWNSRADIDAEIARYFSGFYGAAAGPMRRYWMRIDEAYETTDVHTGSQYGLHRIWSRDRIAACAADLAEARRLAANDRESEAVAMAAAGFRCAELFAGMWSAINDCRFVEAGRLQEEIKTQVAEMTKHTEPNWVHDRYALGYFQRFVGLTIDAGAAALADGGALVAQAGPQWRFAKDPDTVGSEAGWWQPDFDDKTWRKTNPCLESWDDLGLFDYRGDAWYRADLEMPAKLPEGDLRLWFGGFDYDMEVWLNGERLGGAVGFAKPAEFKDLAGKLRQGLNRLAVRVSAGDLAELGTGGLMMPVMVYRWNGRSTLPEGKKGVEYIQ